MILLQSRKTQKLIYIFIASLFVLGLSACAKPADVAPQVTSTPQVAATSQATPTIEIKTTPIATLTANSQDAAAEINSGIVVLSMADGLYSHLFVYNPEKLALTRLTGYNWDDRDAAVSPDGTQVAFSSNRDGQWEIYLLNLKTDELTRVTQTKNYDGAPAWSPDGQYLIYQTLNGDHLNLIIQSIADPESAPIQLTSDAGNNFSPAWSPDGRTIAFITDRSGKNAIWLADLQTPDDRFKVIAASDDEDYAHPTWSPDGSQLAWCAKSPEATIKVMTVSDAESTRTVGMGCDPAFSPDGKTLLAVYDQANESALVGYDLATGLLNLPLIPFPQAIRSIDWKGTTASTILRNFVDLLKLPTPEALFTAQITLPASSTGRSGVVAIEKVNVENAYLADSANESFNALRKALGQKIGWDFLNSLDDAYLPITSPASPGIVQNWLFTGRAIAVNSVPMDANWMVVSREDLNGQTYWRLWLKCLDQTGACGEPLRTSVWDFSSRYSGDTVAYENGGRLSTPSAGYWFDFTEFAHRFGWERLPAQTNWRAYLPGSLFNNFVFSEGKTWQQAMLEIYPPEVLEAAGYVIH
jgi:TolB protein